MDNRIQRQLDTTRKRLRSSRFLYVLGAAWILLWLVAFIGSRPSTGWIAANSGSLRWLEIGAVVCVALAWVVAWLSYRDDRKLAWQIERRFPDLQQSLLTAVEQQPSGPDGRFGYLQTVVAEQTLRHHRLNGWQRVAGPWMTLGAWLVSVVGFLGLLLTLIGLRFAEASADSMAEGTRATEMDPFVGLEVIPGNTQIERGSNLLVTAKFGGAVPREARLVVERESSDRQSVPMTRSLDDPLFGAHFPSVDEGFSYSIHFPGGQSPTFRVDVFELPQLMQADAVLEFPPYTRQAKRIVQDTVRVTVVEGTTVQWQLALNKPVKSARLIDEAGTSHVLEPVGDTGDRFSISQSMTVSKKWRLDLEDAEGRKNKGPTDLSVTVTPNQRPDLKLANARDVSVSALEELSVAAEASDDYGIERAGLSFALADEDPRDLVLHEQSNRQRSEAISHLLDFESMKAQPDQLLAYHFWVEDYGPDGKLRRTPSDMFFAEVRHFEEIFREGQSQPGQQQGGQMGGGQQSEQLAEMQKQIINATWRIIRREQQPDVSTEFADDVHLIAESQEAALEQFNDMMQQAADAGASPAMNEVEFAMRSAATELNRAIADRSASPLQEALRAERAAYQGLLKLRRQEHEVVQGQPGASGSSSGSRSRFQQQLQQLQLKNDRNRYETQREAQQQQDTAERQVRQVLNRLKDLARRQEDLNAQLNELQAALQAAQTEAERQEIERQLRRLRDQQEQMLDDVDELDSLMAEANRQQAVQSSREAVQQTRQNVQEAAESLQSGNTSQALAAGTRAEQRLKDIRDRVRQESTTQFSDRVRELRGEAREIARQQQQVNQQLADSSDEDEESRPALRSPSPESDLPTQIAENRERLNQLFEKLQNTIEQSEPAEPLLSRKLYETLRGAYRNRIDENLRATQGLVERGFRRQARPVAETAGEGIDELKDSLEEAASSVLGNETEGLRRALAELELVSKQLEQEIEANSRSSEDGNPTAEPSNDTPNDPIDRELARALEELNRQSNDLASGNQPTQASSAQPGQPPDGPSGQTGQAQAESAGRPSDSSPERSEEQLADQSNREGSARDSEGNRANESNGARPQASANRSGNNRSRPGLRSDDTRQAGGAVTGGGDIDTLPDGDRMLAPLTGEGFRDWSDRLRDVEEMVEDPRLRDEAAGIRDRARQVRGDFQRHSKMPEWELVEKMIARPIRELRQHVAEELLRRSAEKNSVVPIDRDPVPARFVEQVRRYYERLGSKE
jgi:hypothetical protein